jgi:hypothetical protein
MVRFTKSLTLLRSQVPGNHRHSAAMRTIRALNAVPFELRDPAGDLRPFVYLQRLMWFPNPKIAERVILLWNLSALGLVACTGSSTVRMPVRPGSSTSTVLSFPDACIRGRSYICRSTGKSPRASLIDCALVPVAATVIASSEQ